VTTDSLTPDRTNKVGDGRAKTNMVSLSVRDVNYQGNYQDFHQWCADRGLKFGGRNPARLATHQPITGQQIDRASEIIHRYFEN
jgi:threonine aldolase